MTIIHHWNCLYSPSKSDGKLIILKIEDEGKLSLLLDTKDFKILPTTYKIETDAIDIPEFSIYHAAYYVHEDVDTEAFVKEIKRLCERPIEPWWNPSNSDNTAVLEVIKLK